jgi:inosine-uridine nucleoside N-ribohydrolase
MSKPTPIILDTDMSIDVDDVGALCVAHALEDLGEAKILAITHDTGLSEGVGAVSVINHYYGRDHIPLGAYRGEVGCAARPNAVEQCHRQF